MSKEIDEKVVSLEFDNSKFEKPAEESMSTIEKLKASFNFKGISKGFDTLNQAIRRVTFQPMIDGVQTVYAKFTMMERFAIQLYDRMANYIINTGKKIANETFVAPIRSGKSEYELKMGSIQTIMASTGESLDVVNQKLNELNKYSDDTIYSFQDMTSNIGKFTNAGVNLDDAVAAIKGVSNEAAISGANAAEASRAMYNFAQALSAGHVKLVDWKSIENANMATKSFKEELLKSAEALGTVTKQADGTYKTLEGNSVTALRNFNETLQDQWLTTDVLIKTLKNYADETTDIGKKAKDAATEVKTFSMMVDTLKEALQSGWAETWEHVIGNFEEAKQLWTSVSNVLGGLIERMSNARNAMLKTWKDAGGRTALIEGLAQAWRNLMSILQAIKEAWRNVFPAVTVQRLAQITKGFMDLTRALKPSQTTLINIKRTFTGFFSILGIVKDAFFALKDAMLPVFARIMPKGISTILKGTASLGDMITNLRKTIKEGKYFEKFFGRVATIFETLVNAFRKLFSVIVDIFKAFKTEGVIGMFKAMGRGFIDVVKSMWNYVKSLHILESIKNLGKRMADAISDWPIVQAIKSVFKKVKDAIVNSPIYKTLVGFFEGLVEAVQKAIDKFRGVDTKPADDLAVKMTAKVTFLDKVKGFFAKVWAGLVAVFNTVAPAIKTAGGYIINAIKTVFNGIMQLFKNSDFGDVGLAFAGAGLGAFLWNMAGFFKNVAGTLGESGRFLKQATGVLKDVRGVLKSMAAEIRAEALFNIAKAIALLAASLFVLAAIPADALARGLAAITTLFAGLLSTMNTFNKVSTGDGVKGKAGAAAGIAAVGAQMLLIAVAVGILIADMAILAAIPYEPMIKGMSMLLLMMRALGNEIARLRNSGGSDVKVAAALIAFGLALKSIAKAMAIVAGVTALAGWENVLVGTGAVILTMVTLGEMMKELSKVNKKGTTKIPIAPLLGMIFVMKQLTLSLMLLTLVVAKGGVKNFAAAAGVLVAAVAILLYMFAQVIDMTKKSLGKRGTSITQFIGMGALILIMSNVILKVAIAIALLSHMPQEEMRSAAGAISVLIFAFGVLLLGLGKIMGAKKKVSSAKTSFTVIIKNILPTVGMMMILAGAIVALSAAALVASKANLKGLIFVGAALALLATFVVIGTKILGKGRNTQKGVERLTKIIYALSTAIAAFGLSVLAVAVAFAILSSASSEEIRKFGENLDEFALTLHEHRHGIAMAVGEFLGLIIETIFTSIAGGISGFIRGSGSMIIEALDALIQNGGEIADKIITGALVVMAKVSARAGEIIEAAVVLVVKVIDGLATAIEKHRHEITEAINNLFNAVSKLLVELFGRLLGYNGAELNKFVNQWSDAVKNLGLVVGGFVVLNKIIGIVSSVAKALTNGAKKAYDFATDIGLAIMAVKEYGRKDAFGKVLTQNVGIVTKIGTLIAKWAGPIGVAIGLATTLSGIFKAMSSQIQVISESDKRVSEVYSKIRELETSRRQIEKDRLSRQKDVSLELSETEELINKLKGMIGANGTVISGYETQAKWLIEKINPALGTAWELVENRVKAYDDEGKLLDVNLDKTQELIKTKQLERRLDLMSDDYVSAKKTVQSGELQAAAKKEENILASMETRYYAAALAVDQARKKVAQATSNPYRPHDRDEAVKELQTAEKELNAIQEEWHSHEELYVEYREQLASAQSIMDTYHAAEDALMKGDAEAIERYNAIIKNGINVATTNVPELLSQWDLTGEEEKRLTQLYGAYDKIPESEIRNLEEWRAILAERLKELGGIFKDNTWNFSADALDSLTSGITKSYDKNYLDSIFKPIGGYIPGGLALGIDGNSEDVKKAVDELIEKSCIDEANEKLKIGSPSKVFYEIGTYVVQGFVNAINDATPAAKNTMETAIASALMACNEMVNNPSNRPTIVPMYDTSELQNGSLMDGLSRQVNAGSMTAKLAASVDTSQILQASTATAKEVSALREEVASLKGIIGNLKVYLNGRTLVGEIAPDMDQALGGITNAKRRGI